MNEEKEFVERKEDIQGWEGVRESRVRIIRMH